MNIIDFQKLFEWIGYNTKVFTYENVTREAGESKWTFRKLLNYGIDGLISFNNKPLRMMIYLGMFTFSISILYIIYLLINIIISGINIQDISLQLLPYSYWEEYN